MAVGLRKLASRLSAADIKRLGRAQKLESTRQRLEKEEREHTKRAVAAAKRLERVERKLDSLFGKKVAKAKPGRKPKAKRKISAAGRRAMAAEAKRRWAKHNATKKAKAASSNSRKRARAPAPELVTA
jgi:hypothetical protein